MPVTGRKEETDMKILKSNEYKELVEERAGLCVLDLYADWCGPCRMMAPVMEGLEAEYPDVFFAKVNVDTDGDLAAKFGCESIPMIVLVKGGAPVATSVGCVPAERIAALIEENR